MQRGLLTISRLAFSAWVGGAALFVVTGVREVTTRLEPLNHSPVKDALVTIRFPAYYLFGFALVGTGLLCTVFTSRGVLGSFRRRAILTLSTLALVLMLADYFWIYRPLAEMVSPPGKARPAEFVRYHEASKWINAADVGLCFLAALLACWPAVSGPPQRRED